MLAPRSTSLLRTAAAPRYLPVSPSQRLSQIARHFSGSSSRSVHDAYILAAARTPTGKFCGGLKNVSAPKLASYVIKEAISRSSVPAEKITDVYLGNVLQASIGQAPARQAVIFAGLSVETEAVTVNKVCASGLKAVHFAAQNIQLGLAEAQVAGGMENMSQVPRYLPRNSPLYGHVNAEDGLLKDGLTDVYDKIHMGNCAENTAKNHTITRKEQDDYTIESYRRAKAAWDSGAFLEEVVPITVSSRKGDTVVSKDEEYQLDKVDKIPLLKPVFQKDGTITAASSSTLSDGASAIVLGNKEIAEKHGGGSRVLAKIVGYADAATNPIDFPLAPTLAIPKALQRAGLEVKDIAKWEINEAFAAVSKANEKVLGLDPSKVNVNGGAIALGHALGSSGSRILTTLLYLLKPGEYGVAAICNGGGGASAMVVQRIEKP